MVTGSTDDGKLALRVSRRRYRTPVPLKILVRRHKPPSHRRDAPDCRVTRPPDLTLARAPDLRATVLLSVELFKKTDVFGRFHDSGLKTTSGL